MAISNSIDFTVTRDEIITEALELIGVLGEGESPTSDQLTSTSRTLNMLVKTWQADGLNLFAVTREYLFTTKLQKEYDLSGTTVEHWTDDFVETTINAAVAITDTVITVVSTTGMLADDQVGIGSGTDMTWTTIVSVDDTTTITITDPVTVTSAVGDTVFAFTTIAERPMQILEAYIHIQKSGTDVPMGNISRRRYNRLSIKDTEGLVNQFYYDPQIGAGTVFLWPTSDDATNYVIFFTQKTLSDFDTGSNNPEYPQEWYLPLALTLAVEVAPKYGVPDQEYYKLTKRAELYYDRARDYDQESYTSVYFQHDRRGEEL